MLLRVTSGGARKSGGVSGHRSAVVDALLRRLKVGIVGLPNVGKSTLYNTLVCSPNNSLLRQASTSRTRSFYCDCGPWEGHEGLI